MRCIMCSLASPPPSPYLPINRRPFVLTIRTDVPVFTSSIASRKFRRPSLQLHASIAETSLAFSWFAPHDNAHDDCGGWAVDESLVESKTGKRGLRTIWLGCIGISFVVLVAVIAHLSLKSKGRKFQFGSALNALHGVLMPNEVKASGRGTSDDGEAMPFETSPKYETSAVGGTAGSSALLEKHERVIIPAAVDSTQLEALHALEKLKIIEDNVRADELCTKRVYARWLIRANSLLERNPKHQIVPSKLLPGSIDDVFDDVSTCDPDYWSIKALAEAGIIPSKLSMINSSPDLNGLSGQGGVYFFPERYVSRQDLICWKAQLEYNLMPEREKQIANTHVDFMDVKDINLDASPELFMDILAGDNSILRKVFGQSKRFQPNKPSTNAQAAVAVASGRLTEAIYTELSRLEAESTCRLAVMEEIKSELIGRGEIQSFWDEKLKEEKNHGLEVEKTHLAAVHDLELEKIVQEKNLGEYLKEKAAINCQRKLLFSLKEEVNEISERLICEKAHYMTEEHDLQAILNDLQSKRQGVLDTKSLLEAEKEALSILRSWVEDEARKNQARAKVLEEVGRRWKWETRE